MPSPLMPVIVAEGTRQLAANQDIAKIVDALNPIKMLRDFVNDSREYNLAMRKLEIIENQQRMAYQLEAAKIIKTHDEDIRKINTCIEMHREHGALLFEILNKKQEQISYLMAEIPKIICNKDIDDSSKEKALEFIKVIVQSLNSEQMEAYKDQANKSNEQTITVINKIFQR